MDSTRPTPLINDIQGTREKLESWISHHRGLSVRIPELTIPEATGMSNVTLLFDMEWEESGQNHSEAVVARLQPSIERPVFPDYDLSLQYEVMDAVGRHSDIPVPVLRGLETDPALLGVQFYLMKRTDGRIPTDMPPYNMDGWMVHETDTSQRADLWRSAIDTMGRFHRLDYRKMGLEKLEHPRKTALQQQLDYWQRYHDWALEGITHSICQPTLDWLQANQPDNEPTALCWGDARMANIIFNSNLNGVAAILDWEMAALGNPLQDLAWFNHMDATFSDGLGVPRLEGLPDYEETKIQWAEVSGFTTQHYNYYLIFAGMRFGLLLSRIMLATDQQNEVQANFACLLLQKYMDQLT